MNPWQHIRFQLTNGSSFELVHNIKESTNYSVEKAFEVWIKTAQYPTRNAFLGYLNSAGTVKGLAVPEYKEMLRAEVITDTSIMSFGQHKGKRMIHIPAKYLLYIYEKGWITHNGVKLYIINNMDALSAQSSKIPTR